MKYYEVVVEGHDKAIIGLLEGFILGSGKSYVFMTSREAGIKTETLGEIIKEWVTLKSRLHHIIMEEEFYKKMMAALKKTDSHFIGEKYVRSARLIVEASFEVETETPSRKHGKEIKETLEKLPSGLQLLNYTPKEQEIPEGKGVELYAPEHDYVFQATGEVQSAGDMRVLVDFRKKLDDNPLIKVKPINLKLQ
jgi:hypothetical protein